MIIRIDVNGMPEDTLERILRLCNRSYPREIRLGQLEGSYYVTLGNALAAPELARQLDEKFVKHEQVEEIPIPTRTQRGSVMDDPDVRAAYKKALIDILTPRDLFGRPI